MHSTSFRKFTSTAVLSLLALVGCAHIPKHVDFKDLKLPKSPNYFLSCPKDFCNVHPQQISPIYDMSINDLKDAWQTMIAAQPRTKLISTDTKTQQYTYVQRSKIMRYPDTIYVQFIALANNRSTIAIYSRSKYGYGDMGVNKKRVQTWLQHLP